LLNHFERFFGSTFEKATYDDFLSLPEYFSDSLLLHLIRLLGHWFIIICSRYSFLQEYNRSLFQLMLRCCWLHISVLWVWNIDGGIWFDGFIIHVIILEIRSGLSTTKW